MTNPRNTEVAINDARELSAAAEVRGEHGDSPRSSSWTGKLLALAGALVSLLYLSNMGMGVFELIPDNVPGVGNLDEVLVSLVLIACLQKLGINLLPLARGAALRRADQRQP